MQKLTSHCVFLLSALLCTHAVAQDNPADKARGKELRTMLQTASDRVDSVLLPWCAADADLQANLRTWTPNKRVAINAVEPGSDAELAGLSSGDEVVKIGDRETAGLWGREFLEELEMPALLRSAAAGIPLVAVVKKSKPQEALVSVSFYPRLKCRGRIFLQDRGTPGRARGYATVNPDRIGNFSQDELTALVAWNKAAQSLRLDYAPEAKSLKKFETGHAIGMGLFASRFENLAQQDALFKNVYNDADWRKADLVALLVLRALGMDATAYRSMLAKVAAWEQAHDAFYKVGTQREGFFDAYGNTPKLDAKRAAFLDEMAAEASGAGYLAYAGKMGHKRLVSLHAMQDPGLRGADTTTPLEPMLARYLPADLVKTVLDKYGSATEARLIVVNPRKHQLVLATGNGVETQLAAECGDGCTLLTVNDYTLKRAAAEAAPADFGFLELKAPPPDQPLL